MLLPVAEDLPFLAQPLTAAERAQAEELAARHGATVEESLPISVVGTGPGPERRHRERPRPGRGAHRRRRARRSATAPRSPARSRSGARPGVVQVTFRAPVDRLPEGLRELARTQYAAA